MTTRLVLRAVVVCGTVAAAAAILGEVLANLDANAWVSVLVVVGLTLLGAGLGLMAFGHAGQTLARVSEAATRLAEGEFGERVTATSGPTGQLTRNFNMMAVRLEELFAAIGAEQARLQAAFESSSDAMVALSRDSRVRLMNGAALRLFHTPREAAIDRPFIECALDYELDALVRSALLGAPESGSRVITYGPQRLPLRAAALPISDGGDWALLLILTDLRDVQRVDQVRRDFLSNVSHELRTPLASIRAMVETVENGDWDDQSELAEFMRRIRQQVHRLTLLVNELLDLSRIESGAIELHPAEVDLAEVTGEAAAGLAVRAEAAEVTIDYPKETVLVEADRTSVLRILTNLLDNAIKFSPPGTTVSVTLEADDAVATVSVRDQGKGIPENDRARVFERFYKGDASRADGGVGLGLAIVKHLVRAHNGSVEVSNAAGGGALFRVSLPRQFVRSRRRSAS